MQMNSFSLYRLLISTTILATLTACSSPRVNTDIPTVDPAKEYATRRAELEKTNVISPGFTLRVRHSADSSISGDFKVGFNGMVHFPFKVKVKAAGMTTDELERHLAKAYAQYFKVQNRTTVTIVDREHLIEVRGLIEKPGVYTVKLDTSIEEIIAMAGGLQGSGDDRKTTQPKPEYVRIVRADFARKTDGPATRWIRLTDYFLKYDVSNEVLWRGGEQLFFQITGDPNSKTPGTGLTIQVLGEVRKPGEYPLQAARDLHTYLGLAGGPTSTADLAKVTVIQRSRNDSATYDISGTNRSVDLAPGDIIIVKSTQVRPSFFERLGPTLISLGNLAVSVVILLLAL